LQHSITINNHLGQECFPLPQRRVKRKLQRRLG
jgi:hypothetical protein